MKLAKTMLEANTLLPSVSPVTRNPGVSNKTPAAPEKKKIKHSSSGNLEAPPVVSRMTPRIGQSVSVRRSDVSRRLSIFSVDANRRPSTGRLTAGLKQERKAELDRSLGRRREPPAQHQRAHAGADLW